MDEVHRDSVLYFSKGYLWEYKYYFKQVVSSFLSYLPYLIWPPLNEWTSMAKLSKTKREKKTSSFKILYKVVIWLQEFYYLDIA